MLTAGGQALELESLDAAGPDAVGPFVEAAIRERAVTWVADGDILTVTGVVTALREPTRRGAVPAQAVAVEGGVACVFVVERDGPRRAVPVEAEESLSSEIGVALVPAGLIGATVVLDPGGLTPEERASCG